jgi:hypothetical protein
LAAASHPLLDLSREEEEEEEVAGVETEWCGCAVRKMEAERGGETWKGRGRDARSLEVGERHPEENAWIRFSHLVVWTPKQRGSLARA